MTIRQGTSVKWEWGNGTAKGVVKEVFTSDVTRTIKGTEVSRHASEDEPAYLIHQEDGDRVLKNCNEVTEDK